MLAFLPAPSTNVVHLGPLTLHMYGLMLLAGIVAALFPTRRRWARTGGDPDLVFRVGLLLWIDRRFTMRRPALFALCVSFYTAFRSYEETLRIDLGSHYYLGFRLDFFVYLAVFAASTAFFVWWQFSRPPNERPAAQIAEQA